MVAGRASCSRSGGSSQEFVEGRLTGGEESRGEKVAAVGEDIAISLLDLSNEPMGPEKAERSAGSSGESTSVLRGSGSGM
jgi:hypothetical protein